MNTRTLTHMLFFAGFVAVIVGVALIWFPLAFLAAGGVMAWFSLLIDRETSK